MTDYLKEAQADLALSKRGPHDPAPLYAAQAQAAAMIAVVEELRKLSEFREYLQSEAEQCEIIRRKASGFYVNPNPDTDPQCWCDGTGETGPDHSTHCPLYDPQYAKSDEEVLNDVLRTRR